jgi:spore maturation protein CgeB
MIALIFDKLQDYTTGIYIERALQKLGINYQHFWTSRWQEIKPEFDLYLRIDHGDYRSDLPAALRPSCFWAIDTHLEKPFQKIAQQAAHYDLIFCVHRQALARFARKGLASYWVPPACDIELHQKISTPKTLDLAFIGNLGLKTKRKAILDKLKEKYPNSYIGNAAHTEISKIYSQAKIGINYSLNQDINMRIFEVMSCGTMLLTNRLEPESGFEEIFENGKHLVTYTCEEELFSLVDDYLKNEAEREKIAQAGCTLVQDKHTYIQRTRLMLNLARAAFSLEIS